MVIWDVASFPGVMIPCRALAVVAFEQNREGHPGERVRNDRILVVPDRDRRAVMNSFDAVPQRVRDEIAHFFLAATTFEDKDPKILDWGDAAAALSLVRRSAI
jgi:inorganic pyrophosphatase